MVAICSHLSSLLASLAKNTNPHDKYNFGDTWECESYTTTTASIAAASATSSTAPTSTTAPTSATEKSFEEYYQYLLTIPRHPTLKVPLVLKATAGSSIKASKKRKLPTSSSAESCDTVTQMRKKRRRTQYQLEKKQQMMNIESSEDDDSDNCKPPPAKERRVSSYEKCYSGSTERSMYNNNKKKIDYEGNKIWWKNRFPQKKGFESKENKNNIILSRMPGKPSKWLQELLLE